MGPKPGNGVFWDFSCKFTSGLRAWRVTSSLCSILMTLTHHTEGKGELWCTAPQSGPDLPLSLPGELQHRPEPESRLFNLPTLRHSIVTHVGSARAAPSCCLPESALWQQRGMNYFRQSFGLTEILSMTQHQLTHMEANVSNSAATVGLKM